jgi:hypothetical protein
MKAERIKFLLAFVAALVGIVGTIAGAFFGLLAAGFAQDGNPTAFALRCAVLWGGFGGASLGSTPALFWQCFQRRKWPYPFLGAAAGAAVGLLIDIEGWFRTSQMAGWPLYASLVLLGFIGGGWIWLTKSPTSPVYVERGLRRIVSLIAVGIVFASLGFVGFQTVMSDPGILVTGFGPILDAGLGMIVPVFGTFLGTGLASISWGLLYFLRLVIPRFCGPQQP